MKNVLRVMFLKSHAGWNEQKCKFLALLNITDFAQIQDNYDEVFISLNLEGDMGKQVESLSYALRNIHPLSRSIRDRSSKHENVMSGAEYRMLVWAHVTKQGESPIPKIKSIDPLAKNYERLHKVSEQLFTFLCHLDLQDHPVADQRKLLTMIRELKGSLHELK